MKILFGTNLVLDGVGKVHFGQLLFREKQLKVSHFNEKCWLSSFYFFRHGNRELLREYNLHVPMLPAGSDRRVDSGPSKIRGLTVVYN